MASSPAPITPDSAPRRWPASNRSFTVPAALNIPPKPNDAPDGETETLFVHPNAVIITFSTPPHLSQSPSSTARPGSSSGAQLPWATPTERTLAVGPLAIYRVNVTTGVSFLSSGSLVHALMPRTQCWCVDGVSRFVMRVRNDVYYRIELPGSSDDDMRRVDEFKRTLQKVLFYERSTCPFARTFNLDLPEMPQPKKARRKVDGPAKRWRKDRATWRPEDGSGTASASDDSPSAAQSPAGSEEDSEPGSGQEDEPSDNESLPSATPQFSVPLGRALRSVTAPAQLRSETVKPPIQTGIKVDNVVGAIETAEAQARLQVDADARTPGPSRLRTVQPIPTQMPPSPPYSSADLDHQDHADLDGPAILPSLTAVEQAKNVEKESDLATLVADFETEQFVLSEETQEYLQEIDRQADDVPIAKLSLEPSITELSAIPGRMPNHERSMLPLNNDHNSVPARDTVPGTPLASTSDANRSQEVEPIELSTSPTGSVVHRPHIGDENAATPSPGEPTAPPSEDPYAAIQARILARRSIGGTTYFHPSSTTTRSSSTSAASTATIASMRSSRQQQVLATVLVKRACSAILGPPAHLVALMLRVAARIANSAFGVDGVLHVATPTGTSRIVPGSFDPEGGISSDEESLSDNEDDFGVPIDHPIRFQHRDVRLASDVQGATLDALRERRKRSDAG